MTSLSSSLTRFARAGGLAVAASLALVLPLSPANAGFFDFLFAPLHPAQPAYSPQQYAPSLPKKKKAAAHKPKNLVARLNPAHGPGVRAGAVVGLMDDQSLRNGDVVMTAEGLRVFTGSGGPRHSEDDFARISDIKGLSKTQRGALLALDVGAGGANPALLDGRSVAEAAPTAGEMITDPRGARIRYVGP